MKKRDNIRFSLKLLAACGLLLVFASSSLCEEAFEYAHHWQKSGVGPAPFGPGRVPYESEHGKAHWVAPLRAGGIVWNVRVDEGAWPRINMPMCVYTARDYDTHGLWSRRLHHFFTFNTIDLGSVEPVGSEGTPSYEVEEKDWTHSRLVWTTDKRQEGGESKVTVTVSRLTPAVLIESAGDVMLFAGQKEAADFPTPEWSKLPAAQMNAPYRFSYLIHGKMNIRGASGIHLPAHYAVSDGKRVKIHNELNEGVDVGALSQGWMLCWFGKDSYFYSTRHPLISNFEFDRDGNYYKADCPVLVLFGEAPKAVKETDKGLVLDFVNGGNVIMMPLLGADLPKMETTVKWAEKLPDEIVERCDFWAQRLGSFPVSCSESYAIDADGSVVISERINCINALGRKAKEFAPVPPMLSVAARYGMPVEFGSYVIDTGMLTAIGPVKGIDGVSAYGIKVKGITELVNVKRKAGDSAAPARLKSKLEAEIEKILDAGHLRPWPFMQKAVPGWAQPGYSIWESPGEVLYVLAQAAPLVNEGMRERIYQYMKVERVEFPPEKLFELPFDKGALRPRHRPQHEKTLSARPGTGSYLYKGKRNVYKNVGLIPLESLYYLGCYYQCAGSEGLKDRWSNIRNVYKRYTKYQDWATLGWYARAALLTVTYQGVTRMERLQFPFGGGGAIDTNNAIAGLIGLARMAKMLGDEEAYMEAMGHLGRLAALRVGLAWYTHYLYDNKLVETLEGEGVYGDVFVRTTWKGPLDDNRQVFTLTQFGPDLTYWSDYEWSMNLGTFQGIVPEVGELLKRYAGKPTLAYMDFMEQNWPDWHAAYCEMFYSHEVTYNQPQDPYNMFMANAWIADTPPEKLEKLIDIAWTERGDLYYIMKLAETIKAYRQKGLVKPN